MKAVRVLLTGLGIASAIALAPAAAAAPECTEVAPGTQRCATAGSVQIRTTPPPIGPYIRYGCQAGYTSYCGLPFPGVIVRP